MSLDYESGLRMAGLMKTHVDEIRSAIETCQGVDHGVVALIFTDGYREMTIRILDEPFEPNVRIYQR